MRNTDEKKVASAFWPSYSVPATSVLPFWKEMIQGHKHAQGVDYFPRILRVYCTPSQSDAN